MTDPVKGNQMRRSTRIKSIGAVAGVALALGAAGNAGATTVAATADASLKVVAAVKVPVAVSSASVALRPTTVGPVKHDGKIVETPDIAAGTAVKVRAALRASVDAGSTVAVSTSTYKPVDVTYFENAEGQSCFGIGVDIVADVTVAAGARAWTGTYAKAWGSFDITVGDKAVHSWQSPDVFLKDGLPIKGLTHSESIPVVTGTDVCLPADVSIAPEVFAKAVADAMGTVTVTK